MKYFANGGFYDKAIHGDSIPEGAVEITDEYWRELLTGQSRGLQIVADETGYPQLKEPEPTPLSELKESAISALWNRYKNHQTAFIDAEDLTLAVSMAQTGSVKGAAVRDWVLEFWRKYYIVRDQIEAAADAESLRAISLDPDPADKPPYRVRELSDELVMHEKAKSVTQKIKELFTKKS